MAQTYAFQISLPVSTTLPRDRYTNVVHLEHVSGGVVDTDLQGMCEDILEMYQVRYQHADHEIVVKAYDVDAVPNYPRATASVNIGSVWQHSYPHEIALCLSWHGGYAGNKNERGRIYLMPGLAGTPGLNFERPSDTTLQWALDFYMAPNASFPDLGGIDWKFGTWSKTRQSFKQAQVAWVDDEWDTMRSRGMRATKRVTSTREG
jgi:hypothetical protein